MDNLTVSGPKAQMGIIAGSTLRRIPKQERSRERIDEILKVAMDLIGRKGIDAVTMKEIASLSGGPIASVYQYFPNKSAIIATLYDRYINEVKGLIQPMVSDLTCPDDVLRAADKMIDLYSNLVRHNPSIQDLVNAIQADKGLSDLDIAETRNIAVMFCRATERFVPQELHDRYLRTTFLVSHLAVSCVRLAMKMPARDADDILAEFKISVRQQITYFLVEEAAAA
jgi:AcrR family transcriptional regulator